MRFEDGMTTTEDQPPSSHYDEGDVSAHELNAIMTSVSSSSYALSSVVLDALNPNEEEEKSYSFDEVEDIVLDRDEGDLDGDSEQKVEMFLNLSEVFQEKALFSSSDIVEKPIDIQDVLQSDSGEDHSFMEYVREHAIDVIRDFSLEGGDVLNFDRVLANYDPAQHVIDQFVLSRDIPGGSIVSIDPTGNADSSTAIDMIALENLHNLDLHAMLENGNINLF